MVDLNSIEEFKQTIDGLKGNNNNRGVLAKLVEEQSRILKAIINQSYINHLWESLKFGEGLTTVKDDIEQLKEVITCGSEAISPARRNLRDGTEHHWLRFIKPDGEPDSTTGQRNGGRAGQRRRSTEQKEHTGAPNRKDSAGDGVPTS